MLTKKSFEHTQALVTRLASKGWVLEAEALTPVAALTNQTVIVRDDCDCLDVTTTLNLTNANGLLPNLRDLQFDSLVKHASESVRRQLKIARNLAMPEILDLIQKTRDYIAGMESHAGSTGLKVDTYRLPVALNNTHFRDMLESFKEVNEGGTEQDVVLRFPKRTAAQVIEMFNTGFKGLDEDIAVWLAQKGEVFIENIWRDFFSNDMHAKSGSFYSRCKDQDNQLDLDVITAVHLIARYLKEEVIEESGLELSEYQNIMTRFVRLTGKYLLNAIANYEAEGKNGLLVRRFKEWDKAVVVHGELYDHWLNNGGDIDILYGLILSGEKHRTVDVINSGRERYLSKYRTYCNKAHATLVNNRYNNQRRFMIEEFRKLVYETPTSAVIEDAQSIMSHPNEAFKKFTELLNATSDNELNDLDFTMMRLVTNSRYASQDTFAFLSRLDFYHKENKDLDAREAATLATIDYITDWVAKQMRPVMVK